MSHCQFKVSLVYITKFQVSQECNVKLSTINKTYVADLGS